MLQVKMDRAFSAPMTVAGANRIIICGDSSLRSECINSSSGTM